MPNLSSVFLQDDSIFNRDMRKPQVEEVEESIISIADEATSKPTMSARFQPSASSTTIALESTQTRLKQLEIENRMLRFEVARYDPSRCTTPVIPPNASRGLHEMAEMATSTTTLDEVQGPPAASVTTSASKQEYKRLNDLEQINARQAVEIESLLRQNYILKQEGMRLLNHNESLQAKILEATILPQGTDSKSRFVPKPALSQVTIETVSIAPERWVSEQALIVPETVEPPKPVADVTLTESETIPDSVKCEHIDSLQKLRQHLDTLKTADTEIGAQSAANVLQIVELHLCTPGSPVETVSNQILNELNKLQTPALQPDVKAHDPVETATTQVGATTTRSISVIAQPTLEEDSTQTNESALDDNELLSTIEILSSEKASLQRHITILEETITNWKSEYDSLQDTIHSLEQSTRETSHKYQKESLAWQSKYEDERSQHKRTKAILQSVREEAQYQHQAPISQLTSQGGIPDLAMSFLNDFDHISDLLQTKSALETKLRDATQQVKMLTDDVQKHVNKIEKLEAEIVDRETAMSSFTAEMNRERSLMQDQIALEHNLNSANESLLKDYQNQFTNSLFKCQALPNFSGIKAADLDKHPLDFESIISSLAHAHQEAKAHISNVASKVTDLEREKSNLIARVEGLQNECRIQKEERARLEAEIRESEIQILELKTKVVDEIQSREIVERKMKRIVEAALVMVNGNKSMDVKICIPDRRIPSSSPNRGNIMTPSRDRQTAF
ncbi:hypothetical protein HDV05_001644 [Chytridiales sp. JEL 0842]|nr:hypothetical protein HDV05_001644 [Chytridiales sp. JEL 0842]